jgi:hypothetical protein
MGGKNPERDRLWGNASDPLLAYARDYELTVCCRRPFCTHRRPLQVGLLFKAFGDQATIAQVAARMKCSKCGMHGARIEVRYIGRWGDGR